eukprot:TRINITY_DN15149_c0_g1_i2.p1 TRINITY_DN15149_c0_g1~~TRINITY_DN15149_c0_g1_i2.p1  ORF type:complete len:321 (-),score=42.83 TRINITY_DN15149_c0_g1_i2:283-1245(-)
MTMDSMDWWKKRWIDPVSNGTASTQQRVLLLCGSTILLWLAFLGGFPVFVQLLWANSIAVLAFLPCYVLSLSSAVFALVLHGFCFHHKKISSPRVLFAAISTMTMCYLSICASHARMACPGAVLWNEPAIAKDVSVSSVTESNRTGVFYFKDGNILAETSLEMGWLAVVIPTKGCRTSGAVSEECTVPFVLRDREQSWFDDTGTTGVMVDGKVDLECPSSPGSALCASRVWISSRKDKIDSRANLDAYERFECQEMLKRHGHEVEAKRACFNVLEAGDVGDMCVHSRRHVWVACAKMLLLTLTCCVAVCMSHPRAVDPSM